MLCSSSVASLYPGAVFLLGQCPVWGTSFTVSWSTPRRQRRCLLAL